MATAVAKADIEQSNGASHDRLDRFSLIARRRLRQDANSRGVAATVSTWPIEEYDSKSTTKPEIFMPNVSLRR